MLYNLSEFMTKVKEDVGIKDIPLPVDDQALIMRFQQSALKEFSVRCPYIKEFVLSPSDMINSSNLGINGSVTYRIPKTVYEGTQIIQILGIDTGKTGSGGDYYVPNYIYGTPDMILETIADIKLAASMATMMQHSPTIRFTAPNILQVYNGWYGSSIIVEGAFVHDISLSTVSPTAFTHLIQLATLDMEAYLYNKLKRKNNIDTGIGSTDLKIDEWQNAQQEMRDLLQKWDDEGANLDVDTINYWA